MADTSYFSVSPTSSKFELKAGETYEGYITVSNPQNSTKDFEYKVTVAPYTIVDNSYTADFMNESDRTQIANWITVENPTGSVKPNETVEVYYRIEVPENVPSGGQYAALLVGSNFATKEESGISIGTVSEIASLIFATVDGEIEHKSEIRSNTIPGFVTSMPIVVSAELSNDGNVHETAVLDLTVKNVFGGQTIFPAENETSGITEEIMPDSSRFLTKSITDVVPLGIYEVTQSITYGDDVSVVQQVVFACPIWFMMLVAACIVGVVVGIIEIVRKHRRIVAE